MIGTVGGGVVRESVRLAEKVYVDDAHSRFHRASSYPTQIPIDQSPSLVYLDCEPDLLRQIPLTVHVGS
jgi:hypothetical protein